MAFVPLLTLGKRAGYEGFQALCVCGVCTLLHSEALEDSACKHAHTAQSICTYLPRQDTAYTGTCSCTYVFVRRDMRVLTQCLLMCKLLIAHIQTLTIKLVLDAPLLFFVTKNI